MLGVKPRANLSAFVIRFLSVDDKGIGWISVGLNERPPSRTRSAGEGEGEGNAEAEEATRPATATPPRKRRRADISANEWKSTVRTVGCGSAKPETSQLDDERAERQDVRVGSLRSYI